MTDDLRTRIAKVLHTRYGRDLGYADHDWDEIDQAAYLADADAVIAELGLERELHIVNDRAQPRRRYVTEWTHE